MVLAKVHARVTVSLSVFQMETKKRIIKKYFYEYVLLSPEGGARNESDSSKLSGKGWNEFHELEVVSFANNR